MARKRTGTVVVRERAGGTAYALRVSAYGRRHYLTLGTSAEGWTRERADRELRHVVADIERGMWQPPTKRPEPEAPAGSESFHEFATDWFKGHAPGLSPRTAEVYLGQLKNHLLPFFKDHALREITVAEVDRYRAWQLRRGRLSNQQINYTITRLGQILDVAHERELIDRNPVRVNPSRRKLKVRRKALAYLDGAEQITAVLDAAGELDRGPRAQHRCRRPFMATLIFAGLRITEACDLERRDLDLANGRLHIRASKTDAGVREVDLLPVLRDELAAYVATMGDVDPRAPLFPTARGGKRRTKDSARQGIVDPVVAKAREADPALPDKLTAHRMRATFASVLLAVSGDPVHVMRELGHTDPGFTLRAYARFMKRSEAERESLRALVAGEELAPIGTTPSDVTSSLSSSARRKGPKLA